MTPLGGDNPCPQIRPRDFAGIDCRGAMAETIRPKRQVAHPACEQGVRSETAIARRLWGRAAGNGGRSVGALGDRGPHPRQPLRRLPQRRPPAGRLFRAWGRPSARRAARPRAALHARPRDRRQGRRGRARGGGCRGRRALRGLSLDRLRRLRALRPGRRASLQRAARTRHHRRRRLCERGSGAAPSLSPRRGRHRPAACRQLHVLGPHGL